MANNKSNKAKGAAPLPEPVEHTGDLPVTDTPSPDDILDIPADELPDIETTIHSEDEKQAVVKDIPSPGDGIDTPPADDDPFLELLSSYAKAYPAEKEFHVTSDHQVFLKANARYAQEHQAKISKDAAVKIYSIQ